MDGGLEALPWRVESAQEWAWVDRRATALSRGAAYAGALGALGVGLGGGLVVYAQTENGTEGARVAGLLSVLTGSIAMVGAPPIAYASGLRARRSLVERGVYVSAVPGGVGWALYAVGIVGVPLCFSAVPESPAYALVGTAWYGAIVGVGLGQLDVNRVGREAAGLEPVARHATLGGVVVVPTGRGVALAGAF